MKLYLNSEESSITLNKKDYLLRAAQRFGFDFVLDYDEQKHQKVDNILNIEPYQRFIKGNHWTGTWEIDLIMDRPELCLSDWVESDVVFVANTVFTSKTEPHRHKTLLLFQACDPELHKPNGAKKEFDFVFSGSIGLEVYEKREQALKLLRQKFSFQDFGKGHPPEKYVKYLNKARVQFIRSGSNHISDGHLAQRFFECLALGPVLVDYHPDLELTGLIDGVDYISYKNDNEMMHKMSYLINNPEEAEKIARSGRQKALSLHTYEHRLISILNLIQDKNAEGH